MREQGLTNRQIANKLNISTQRVWAVLNPEKIKAYRHGEKYREYKRNWERENRKKKGDNDVR